MDGKIVKRDIKNLCLNDQGGDRMDVLFGKTGTLRSEARHPQIVLEEKKFINHPLTMPKEKTHGKV